MSDSNETVKKTEHVASLRLALREESRSCVAADTVCWDTIKLTVQDVSQALGSEQLLQSSHFILQIAHQLIVGILVDDSIAFDVFSSVSIPKNNYKYN